MAEPRGESSGVFSMAMCLGLVGIFVGVSGISWAEPPLSRDMQLGIFYFKHGEDSQAMDRFVEVLNQGSPAERTLANSYLNQITQRMTGGGATIPENKDSGTPASAAPEKQKVSAGSDQNEKSNISVETKSTPVDEKTQETSPASPESNSIPPASSVENPSRSQIKKKIENMSIAGLRRLRALPGVVVVARKDGGPLAVAIPSGGLFSSKINFRNQAKKIIEALSATIYGEGKAKILVFPEGAVFGDVKVIDMRRAVAVADSLVASGISSVRVQTELLTGGSSEIPKRLFAFKGIIFIFSYGESLNLKAPQDEDGPPLSLGVSAPSFRVDRGEGSLIEFSVEEPSSGVRFWKFQILRQEQGKSKTIEEVVGSGPVFHQVYWDGRKNYSGPQWPSGSYECLLTAEDGAGRMRAIHRWIAVEGSAGDAVKTASVVAPRGSVHQLSPAAAIKKSMPASLTPIEKTLQGGKRVIYVQLPPNKRKNGGAINSRGRNAKKMSSAPFSFELLFKPGTYQLVKTSKKNLLNLARKMAKDKKAHYEIIGYAKPSEKNAKNLCRQRAQVVAGLFINKYRISIKRLRVKSEVSALGKPRVTVKKRGSVKKWKKS